MRIGPTLPQLGPHVDLYAGRGFARSTEALGYDALWVQQHHFYPPEPTSGYSARAGLAVPDAYRSILSPLEVLAAVAAWTERIGIGTNVCDELRSPQDWADGPERLVPILAAGR